MIKRTLEISRQPVHLSIRHGQLVLTGKDEERTELACVPCEDVGVLLVDEGNTTYTHSVLVTLLEHDGAVVLCGRNHLPAGLLLPLGSHTEIVWRIHDQIDAPKPLAKQLWKQIIQAKIAHQADNLGETHPKYAAIRVLERSVRSGDPNNVEAQAARAYWPAMFDEAFRRDPDGEGVNALLNYGYAVMRAAVARAIVAAGLLPALGLHHCNRSNAFCLADDLVEPLRPIVDRRVREIVAGGDTAVSPETKPRLLELLAMEVTCGDQTGPLMVALHRYVASLVKCLQRSAKELEIPRPVWGAAPANGAGGD